ncbi:MAG: HD-GYP domain-containing protein [Bacteriovoracaceae bacterium]
MSDDKKETEYAAVPLSEIIPEQDLVTDIYLKINEKYLKYKEKSDFLKAHKYDLFMSKNVKEVYIHISELKTFMGWLEKNKADRVDEIVEQVGEDYRELVEKREEIKGLVFETFADQELDSEIVDILKDQIKGFVAELSEKDVSQNVVARLMAHNPSLADHALNVANLSVFLGMTLGYGSAFDLENLYLGGLLHEYGKIKIPANVLENPSSPMYAEAISRYPELGAKLLKKHKNIPQQVVMIVGQHCEKFNGQGFPRGLKGEDIYPLAKIVSIAVHFDNAVIKNIKKPSQMYKIACKTIEHDRGSFDPKMLERVVDGLKLAYTNFEK